MKRPNQNNIYLIGSLSRLLFFAFFSITSFASDYSSGSYPVEKIYTYTLDSSIHEGTFKRLEAVFDSRKFSRGDLFILKMDTPGGQIDVSKKIIQLFSKQLIPIITWISPKGASATSAGAIISSGTDFIVISEGGTIGAAAPIRGDGKDIPKTLKLKIVNELKSLVRSQRSSRNKDPKYYELMIEEAKSYSAKEALELEIVDALASSKQELIEQIDEANFVFKGDELVFEVSSFLEEENSFKPLGDSFWDEVIEVLTSPTVCYSLFMLGLMLIYVEILQPGGFIAGLLGFGLVLLSSVGMSILPFRWAGIALIALGFVFVFVEFQVTSFGVLGLAGVVCFFAGTFYLFDFSNYYGESYLMALFGVLLLLIVIFCAVFFSIKKMMKIAPTQPSFFDPVGEIVTIKALLGKDGNDHVYQVEIKGDLWRAHSVNSYKVGDKVIVLSENKVRLILIIGNHPE